jgi:hypothetical protein
MPLTGLRGPTHYHAAFEAGFPAFEFPKPNVTLNNSTPFTDIARRSPQPSTPSSILT